jgi:hypothetical protein
MPRIKTPSFVAEFPLQTTAADEAALDTRLNAARNLYNACQQEALRRLALMRQSKAWQDARKLPRKERGKAYRIVKEDFGFTSREIEKHALACRNACWIGDHMGSHDTQTISLRAFRAVEQYCYRVRGRPRFKAFNRLHSIEGKADAVIRYRLDPVPAVHWSGLVLPLMLDPRDRRGWQTEALQARTKYVRVIRRNINGRNRWFCQLVQEGLAPATHETQQGIVGLDIGPSTIAAVATSDAVLEQFCPTVVEPWKDVRRIQRAMDRSRRTTNPDNFDAKGRAIKGRRKWTRSSRYQALAIKKRERDRRLASERKRSHGELANRILGQGTTIKTEKLSYKSFQKNFGRSVKVRAPGTMISTLQRKAESAGGGVIEINTRHTKLSQFDHTTGEYVKKPLSQRVHVFGDGVTKPVQRDLYSAFLATCCDTNSLDVSQVERAWPGAEPLLRRGGIEVRQPASGKGFARPHVRNGVRAGRPYKRVGPSAEAGDAVAPAQADQARAPKRSCSASLRTPWL